MYFSFEVEAHKSGCSYAGTDYVKAKDYDQAFYYIKDRLIKAGWSIDLLKGHTISVMVAEE